MRPDTQAHRTGALRQASTLAVMLKRQKADALAVSHYGPALRAIDLGATLLTSLYAKGLIPSQRQAAQRHIRLPYALEVYQPNAISLNPKTGSTTANTGLPQLDLCFIRLVLLRFHVRSLFVCW